MEQVPPGTEHGKGVVPVGEGAEQPQMFGHLLASRPSRSLWATATSSVTSIVVHGAIIAAAVVATMGVSEAALDKESYKMIELPPEPPPPPPPVVKVQAEVEAPKGFQTLSVPDYVPPDIPPPAAGFVIREEDYSGLGAEGGVAKSDEQKTVEQIAQAPTFTPFTLAPELLNRDQIAQLLVRNYPPLLRDAGIGGSTLVWLFINESGIVQKTQVKSSSGYTALDEAALSVANAMRFRAAMNRDKKVPVWVEIPILFTAK